MFALKLRCVALLATWFLSGAAASFLSQRHDGLQNADRRGQVEQQSGSATAEEVTAQVEEGQLGTMDKQYKAEQEDRMQQQVAVSTEVQEMNLKKKKEASAVQKIKAKHLSATDIAAMLKKTEEQLSSVGYGSSVGNASSMGDASSVSPAPVPKSSAVLPAQHKSKKILLQKADTRRVGQTLHSASKAETHLSSVQSLQVQQHLQMEHMQAELEMKQKLIRVAAQAAAALTQLKV